MYAGWGDLACRGVSPAREQSSCSARPVTVRCTTAEAIRPFIPNCDFIPRVSSDAGPAARF